MYDLHLHLDGSFSAQGIVKACRETGTELEEKDVYKIAEKLRYNSEAGNLTDYLKCFELPVKIMQTPEIIRFSVMNLLNDLKKDGVDYAEIRFAPQLHTLKGFSQLDITKAAIEALEYGELLGVSAKFILCMMRGDSNFKENEITIDTARELLGQGVAAIDLAGDESTYKTGTYKELFEYANKYNIPFTIHAGEADGPDSIEQALSFGAKRIGHGIAAVNDRELLKFIKQHEIGIEVCPVSNMQTGAVEGYDEYPLFKFLDMGVCAGINTDNRVVSNTNIHKEFDYISKIEGYKDEYRVVLAGNSKKMIFK